MERKDLLEANAAIFSERIAETPLKDVVFAPTVIDDKSTRTVLVTEWVDGERLDRCSNEDVTVLCSIAMNTYLTMLLESGTSSGLVRICILKIDAVFFHSVNHWFLF